MHEKEHYMFSCDTINTRTVIEMVQVINKCFNILTTTLTDFVIKTLYYIIILRFWKIQDFIKSFQTKQTSYHIRITIKQTL